MIAVVGGIATDVLVRVDELAAPGTCRLASTFYEGCGGKAANQAVAAARLGARVELVGAVGDDERGASILARFASENVGMTHVARVARTPTGAVVTERDRHRRKQVSVLAGANACVTRTSIDAAADVIRNTSVIAVQLEIPLDAVLRAAELAREAHVPLVLDPSPIRALPEELLRCTYAIKPNAHEATALTGIDVRDRSSAQAAAANLLRRGVALVAIEAGDAGNLFATGDEEVFVPRIEVDAVDPMGAGDALTAALAIAIAESMPLTDAAWFASAAAALTTRRLGAQEGMPRRAEVETLLDQRPASAPVT